MQYVFASSCKKFLQHSTASKLPLHIARPEMCLIYMTYLQRRKLSVSGNRPAISEITKNVNLRSRSALLTRVSAGHMRSVARKNQRSAVEHQRKAMFDTIVQTSTNWTNNDCRCTHDAKYCF